ncbi:MAG: PAS domain S-box protein [Nitrospirae bacterium]|nr:PAS domain S-box protein [Nitrospirota bacterium]MBI3352120.1 PAS domain S-box protein [Nitrospirota bacterium]
MTVVDNKGSTHRVKEDFRERIKWLIILRVALMTLLLGGSLLFQIGGQSRPSSWFIPSILLGIIYFLSVLYVFLLGRVKNLVIFSIGQMIVDVFIETILVMFTGSVESPFSFLYIISIISGALILNRSGGIFIASLAFICYGSVVDLEYYQWGWFAYFTPPNMTEKEAFYSFFLYLVIFFTVAIVSGTLSEKLHDTRKALDDREKGLTVFRAFHENVVRSMGSGLLTSDLDGNILSFNASAQKITCFLSSEIIGNKWWNVFGWEKSPVSLFEKGAEGENIRFDKEGHKKDGSRLLVGMTFSPLKDDEGFKKGYVGIFQDLTKIKELEEAMKLKERLAHLGEMAAGIAHEIRNPLASLSGSMEILSQELNLKDHQKKLMQIALNESERLNHLIADFLNYTRPRPLQKKETFLKSFLEEEIFLFKHSVTFPKDIRIDLAVDPLISVVDLDQDQMKQVFWNLSLNACEAMSDGGRLKISAKGWPSNEKKMEEWFLIFEDNGVGISPDAIGKIFNPFFSTKDHGTGLGLSIVHRIIEEHGGKVRVKSAPGVGTRFTLIFPFREFERFPALDQRKESVIG